MDDYIVIETGETRTTQVYVPAGTKTHLTVNEAGTLRVPSTDAVYVDGTADIGNSGLIDGNSGGKSDGIDFRDYGAGSVNNFSQGTITGARHGITGHMPVEITNYGEITGRLGAGINLDTDGTSTTHITNFGSIVGTAMGTVKSGDGVDVDGQIDLQNYGSINALGSWSDGVSEAVTVGGGVINNHFGATIFSDQRAVSIDGGNGKDAFAAIEINNEGTIQGSNGEAIVIVGPHDDKITNSGSIQGSIFTGAGNDTVTSSSSGGIEVYGEQGNDFIHAGNGNNVLHGGTEGDQLIGGSGDDSLFGDEGDDYLDGGHGVDYINGGDGTDLLSYWNSSQGVEVYLDNHQGYLGDAQGYHIYNVKNVGGSGHQDTLQGNDQNNKMNGYDGDDHLCGQGGHDYLNGDGGNDVLFGGGGNDIMIGGDGYDQLFGGEGNDTMYAADVNHSGESGSFQDGGSGQDQLTGSAGADIFYCGETDSGDAVYYFNGDEGDRLRLQGAYSYAGATSSPADGEYGVQVDFVGGVNNEVNYHVYWNTPLDDDQHTVTLYQGNDPSGYIESFL
jgi:Ca2+-binding RTX toxin-like protein